MHGGCRQHTDLPGPRRYWHRRSIIERRQLLKRSAFDRAHLVRARATPLVLLRDKKMAARTKHHRRTLLIDIAQPQKEAAHDAAGSTLEVGVAILNIHVLVEAKRCVRLRISNNSDRLIQMH